MKKVLGRLLILTLGLTVLSGCDFFSSGEVDKKRGDEDHEVKGLVLKDYSTSVFQNSKYEFDGKVYLSYEDSSIPEYEVTSDCSFSEVDTSTIGQSELKVSYEGSKYIYSKKVYINVKEYVTLKDLVVENYTSSVKRGNTYTFNGTVTAKYSNNTSKDVTKLAKISTLDTSSAGQKPLDISFTEDGITKTKTVEIKVYDARAKLSKIVATSYTAEIEKNQTYTFDGVVTATFADNTTEVVTKDCEFDYDNSFSTSTAGTQSLKIKYTTNYTTSSGQEVENYKTTAASILVFSVLTGISGEDVTVGVGRTKTINLTYSPSDATYKGVSYSSSDTSVAEVNSSGTVTGKAEGTAEITITSTKYSGISTTINVSVETVVQDAWTIFIYMCGSNLESGWDSYYHQYTDTPYLATGDLDEIKSVSGKPDDINIVVEAGGAKRWNPSYSSLINANKLNRFHLTNTGWASDEQITLKDMGATSTLQEFLEWGIQKYPAEKMALILWNHGGGLHGCCNDEVSNGELLNNEVEQAVSGAFTNKGISKFEWIGYDCCLMQTMEVADFNSPYFNYMIASQESEGGDGWAYDEWVDNLYKYQPTETILTEIVDTCIDQYGGVNASGQYDYYGNYYPADQTLSYLDLTKMDEFKTSWESLANATYSKFTSTNKSQFKSDILEVIQHFAGDDYTYFAEFDCKDYLLKLENNSTFNPGGNYVSNAKTAFGNLVKHSVAQKEASSGAYGLSFYFGSDYNSSNYSNFTNWSSIITKVGGYSYY